MKKLIIPIFAITLGGCMNMNSDQPQLNINYPAAYVVNGESSTVSVINLNTNEVADLVQLTDGTGTQMQGMNMGKSLAFPHHIYLNASKTQVAIAAPGMDLSAGHTGGMAGMTGKIAVLDATTGVNVKIVETPIMNHNAIYFDGRERNMDFSNG
ncbi:MULTISPECIES: hypothetical protein [unclassified Arcicella]|uniref:hypothetical protein n=1 Tax=unclassified Arcicella TaxID=2644986 RepID=UPI0028569BF4|nr:MULTISPECIES: hypothetical protein [unclassified Arcicella]MDR6563740.1 YVTN family beta-propeller protein [Arcicella sp. BE51]MDR6813576.1 YVTN family beta-propeller protein [Arcicella sp. BE140]MDR6824888.1 YVTN family beta-propeller protein [Arcicella sp. BE139]